MSVTKYYLHLDDHNGDVRELARADAARLLKAAVVRGSMMGWWRSYSLPSGLRLEVVRWAR